jgi:hypothetical protein
MAATKTEIKQHLSQALAEYARRIEAGLNAPGSMAAWVERVHHALCQQLDQLPPSALAPTPGEHWGGIPFTPEARREVQELHKHWVITYMDKGAGNFVAYCKKGYVQQLLADVSRPEIYERSYFSPDILAKNHSTFSVRHHFTPTINKASTRLPFYAAITKLHKTPIANRYLVCSSSTSLADVSKWFTHLFRAILPDVDAAFAKTLARVDPDLCPLARSWILTNSQSLIPMIHCFNAAYVAQHATANYFHQSFDFARLYTNLPLLDVASRVCGQVKAVFEANAMRAIKVYARGHPPEWLDTVPTQLLGKDPRLGRYRIFQYHHFSGPFRYFLANTYFVVGDRVFRQRLGIPMGTNCAVYVANLYLHSYELEFVSRLTDAALSDADAVKGRIARSILRSFTYTTRYIDDLITLHNKLFRKFTYTDNIYLAFPGIYPPCLRLEGTGAGQRLHYMDVHICPCTHTLSHRTVAGSLTTKLYDKRRQPHFQHVRIVRFPHFTSLLSRRCKYGVLTSQFHRYTRIILDKNNFTEELARLVHDLVDKGYSPEVLHRHLRSLLRRYPELFDCYGPKHLFHEVQRQL